MQPIRPTKARAAMNSPRFRTGMRLQTGPATFGKPGLAHMVNYLRMAEGGAVDSPWQQFDPNSSNYFGASGQTVPGWMQRGFGAASAQNQTPRAPGGSTPQAGLGQQGASPQPMGLSWADQRASEDQAPAWYQNTVGSGANNVAGTYQPPAPSAAPAAPATAPTTPPMPAATAQVPGVAAAVAPVPMPTQQTQSAPAAPPDMAANRAAAAVAPPSPAPAQPSVQSMDAPATPEAPTAQPMASPATTAPASWASQSPPSQPVWTPPQDMSPATLGYDPQQQPGSYGYINPVTGSPLSNYAMGPTGGISYGGNNPGGEAAAANYAALPHTDPATLGYDPQQQPGSYGYVNPTTGTTMPNYSMGPTGSITQNFPGYARGGPVKMGIGGDLLRVAGGAALPEAASSGNLGMLPQWLMQQAQKPQQQRIGLSQMAHLGQGQDDSLAHVSSDEIHLLDRLRGGTEINPETGLPQYGWLGNMLKGLVRAGAAIAGGMIAGPAGAAVGSGLATKLTGGSWNDALKGAALSGIGSYVTGGLQTSDWSNVTGGVNPAIGGKLADLNTMREAVGEGALTSLPEGLTPGLGSQFLAAARSAPGMVAGLGALSNPIGGAAAAAALPQSGPAPFSVKPMQRTQMPYQGDLSKYGFGPGHKWYDTINPAPDFGPPVSGGVDYSGVPGFAGGGDAGLAAQPLNAIAAAAKMGYMAAKKGGAAAPHAGPVYGPGGGQADLIPARLSSGEYVMDAETVSALGDGSTDAGIKKLDQFRQDLRAHKRGAAASKIPPKAKGIGSYMKIVPRVTA